MKKTAKKRKPKPPKAVKARKRTGPFRRQGNGKRDKLSGVTIVEL
jgi:hypothetical protein